MASQTTKIEARALSNLDPKLKEVDLGIHDFSLQKFMKIDEREIGEAREEIELRLALISPLRWWRDHQASCFIHAWRDWGVRGFGDDFKKNGMRALELTMTRG